ncbi:MULTISPECIES: radical SAM protein [unclassified Bradyrhizobium]|uniref:radical SAM/SPASM domain-containing protein n=1 Tax=unclassified Bradyrhizobium TaxID=2631580 RepID=UPI002915F6C7|nr:MULTISPECIES: radical SAM protein [unclassified Bradyrhizobium]
MRAFEEARAQNLKALRLAYASEAEIIPALPTTLMIEPTNACNLACPLCPTGAGTLKRPKGMLRFQNFKKIVDELAHSLTRVVLWNYGEPYLNKEIYAMFDYCREIGVHTTVSSNGFPLEDTDPDARERLLDHPPDHLIVSIDGATASSHQAYRIGSDFYKLTSGLRQFVIERNKRDQVIPKIESQCIVMKHNEHEIEGFCALMKQIGVDVITLKSVNISMADAPESEAAAMISVSDRSTKRDWLPIDMKLARYDERMRAKHVPTRGCARPWEMIVVNQDGNVAPCCYDIEASLNLGNAFESSIERIWNSENYQDLRRKLKVGRDRIPLCSVCTDQSPTVLWRDEL